MSGCYLEAYWFSITPLVIHSFAEQSVVGSTMRDQYWSIGPLFRPSYVTDAVHNLRFGNVRYFSVTKNIIWYCSVTVYFIDCCIFTSFSSATSRSNGLLDGLKIFTGRMPRSGKLPVLFLLTGQKSGFLPRRGDSLHRFRSNYAISTGTWVRLAVQNFTSIGADRWECGPQNINNFHFLVKSRPVGATPLTDFQNL